MLSTTWFGSLRLQLFKLPKTAPMRNKLLPLAGTATAIRAGFAIARDTREIATEWSRCHQDVMRHSSKAGQALLRVRTFKDMLEVQATLLRGTTQSFHDRIVKIVETASRMAMRPDDAPKEASVDRTGRYRADMAAESVNDDAGRL
jgi:hypothetical protein